MEKRNAIGLRGFFTRSLLLAVLGVVAIVAVCLILLQVSFQTGLAAPANAGETQARAEMDRQRAAGAFLEDIQPGLYDYVYFRPDGDVAASSLEGGALEQEISRYPDRYTTYGTAAYLLFDDGSACLFSWRYQALFVNPALQRSLPTVDTLLVVLMAVSVLAFFLLYVRHISRRFRRRLAIVEAGSRQIAVQDLDTPITTSVGIREFDDALRSMETMRKTLKESLTQQWAAEHQRKQEIAALAHDLKTPLTIISGNAELMMEEPLGEEQAQLVQSIHTAGATARRYVKALQETASLDAMEEERQLLEVPALMREMEAALRPLAQAKGVALEIRCDDDIPPIRAYPSLLARALINIGENAIRFTPPGGCIAIAVTADGKRTTFHFEDEGPGFTKEALAHATEMFWQQDKSRSSNENYGMGLAIAARAVQRHGGRLQLENTKNGGLVSLVL